MTEPAIRLSGGSDRSWTDAMVAACPSLRVGCRPRRWGRTGHAQAVLAVAHDDRAPEAVWDLDRQLTMDDGGTVSLQWLGLDAAPTTPVLVVLHTICGSGRSLRRFLFAMRRRLGWVVVACNRRGHADLPLTAPSINTMGRVEDLDAQLDAITKLRPEAPLYVAGISAGSGLLVRYLGERGAASRFRAAVAVCPAYDMPGGLRNAHPRYDRYMTRKLVRFFLDGHRDVLAKIDGFEHCAAARTLVEFHDRLYPLAGFESREDYIAACDPMAVAGEVVTPSLILNAEDDPVCSATNVHRHAAAIARLPRVVTALTRFGGHCGFYEGAGADTSWSDRAIAEFLIAAHALEAAAVKQ